MALEVTDRQSGVDSSAGELYLTFTRIYSSRFMQIICKGCKSSFSYTYMTISFLMGLLETNSVASFSFVIGSVAFTMFWNMVLFLQEQQQAHRGVKPIGKQVTKLIL